MKKNNKIITSAVIAVAVAIVIVTSIIFMAGGSVDVINTYAKQSLGKVYQICETAGYLEGDTGNYSLSVDGKAEFYRKDKKVGIRVDVTPFLNAGLDVDVLPIDYTIENGFLIFETEENRNVLGYHAAMGHFNYALGDDNAFEWAQDMSENDKDIVFALNPEPFISAGVIPENVTGWQYAEVEMHKDGKTVEAFRFLKAFDLA